MTNPHPHHHSSPNPMLNQPPPLPSEGGDPLDTSSQLQKAEEIGRLQSTFLNKSYSDHPSTWDSLWNDSYTPWDRGGPSLALRDVVVQHPDLFPFPSHHNDDEGGEESKRPKALVPGCGRGHDVLLLSQLGYDAYGLDFSERAIEEAKENEKEFFITSIEKSSEEGGDGGSENAVVVERRRGRGKVTWVAGDFFGSYLEQQTGVGKFDLIFDYTFFCALPPNGGRSNWSSRVTSLLTPQTGRLVCLEWPLHKPPKTGGPPWGVTPQVYLAHLSHPGEPLPYDDECNLVIDDTLAEELKELEAAAGKSAEGGNGKGLERIARVRPTRTHKAGYDPDGNMVDFISVWKTRGSS